MESQYARKLKSGREYDHLFPRPGGKDHEISRKASVGDTVHFIIDQVPQTLWQTKEIARLLKGRNLHETCRNLWNFVYQHIQYQKDEDGTEQVRSPRRLWWERKGDCDCYTTFISSVLFNLGIPHKYRITKYDKEDPSEIRWQHIYPVVPKNGRLDGTLDRRGEYIVIDCVKDAYDTEQPYLEKQDFECKMKLNYLDGIEDEGMEGAEAEYAVPPNVDARDLAALYDEEELGKAGWLKKTVKKVGKAIGKGIRFINRVANPATMLLRNGFLLAMKENLFRIAGKLRYAYLSDAQAVAQGMNLNVFHKLKKVLEKAEKIYHGAGGKTDKLKLAILKGKGNHDHKVSLSGLSGLDDVYADEQEYTIIHNNSINGFGDLGEPATAATIAAATAALTALGAALKSVKGLFPKGSKEATEFEKEDGGASGGGGAGNGITDAGNTISNLVSSASALIPQGGGGEADSISEDSIVSNNTSPLPVVQTTAPTNERREIVPTTTKEVAVSNDVSNTETDTTTSASATQGEEKKSLMKDPVGWVKENPGKAALGVAGLAGLAYLGFKAMSGNKKGGTAGLAGIPPQGRRKKRRGNKKKKTAYRKSKIKAIKIL